MIHNICKIIKDVLCVARENSKNTTRQKYEPVNIYYVGNVCVLAIECLSQVSIEKKVYEVENEESKYQRKKSEYEKFKIEDWLCEIIKPKN